jgi:hypothetical protein
MNGDWKPTGKLRWIVRRPEGITVLQCWWAPDVPSYMLGTEGEWRDVPLEDEP